jgi:hypothetical protein
MTPIIDRKVLICGESLLLCAIAVHLQATPGIDVQVTRGLTRPVVSGFVPDIILMENDLGTSPMTSRIALSLLAEGTAASVFLLDAESSALTVLSSHTVPVSSLSDVMIRIEQTPR